MEEIKASAISQSGKGIEKMYAYLQDTKQSVQRGESMLQATCLHQRNKQPSLKKTNRSDTQGHPIWICRRCTKDISLQQINLDELDKALKLVDQAIDVIKILSNPDNDKDLATLKKLCKMQYRLPNVKKLYVAATTGGNKKKRNNGEGGPRGSVWRHGR